MTTEAHTLNRLLFHARRFRACRIFLPPHCHVNGLCPLIPAEWEDMRRRRSTYTLWLAFLQSPSSTLNIADATEQGRR